MPFLHPLPDPLDTKTISPQTTEPCKSSIFSLGTKRYDDDKGDGPSSCGATIALEAADETAMLLCKS